MNPTLVYVVIGLLSFLLCMAVVALVTVVFDQPHTAQPVPDNAEQRVQELHAVLLEATRTMVELVRERHQEQP